MISDPDPAAPASYGASDTEPQIRGGQRAAKNSRRGWGTRRSRAGPGCRRPRPPASGLVVPGVSGRGIAEKIGQQGRAGRRSGRQGLGGFRREAKVAENRTDEHSRLDRGDHGHASTTYRAARFVRARDVGPGGGNGRPAAEPPVGTGSVATPASAGLWALPRVCAPPRVEKRGPLTYSPRAVESVSMGASVEEV